MAQKVSKLPKLTPKEKWQFFMDHQDMAIETLMSKLGVKKRTILGYRTKAKKLLNAKKESLKTAPLSTSDPNSIKPELTIELLSHLWSQQLPDDPREITKDQMKMGLEIVDKQMRYKKQFEDEAKEAIEEEDLNMEAFRQRAKAIIEPDAFETEETIY